MAKNILLIDDEPFIRDAIGESLEDEGYLVQLAESGLEGVKLYQIKKPDLVLLDYTLTVDASEGFSGERTFYKLREIDPESRILIVSGNLDNDGLKKLSANGYVQKPIYTDKLVEIIEKTLKE